MIELEVGAATHVGRNPGRTNNEDRYLVTDGLWVVADGVGGHAGGEVAAGLAVEIIGSNFDASSPQPLASVIEKANRAVWDRAGSDPELHGMATTITAIARVERDGATRLTVANVGDSRTYLLRQGELTQVSVDHSQVEEMVRDGLISRAEAARHPYRHVVTRVLGMESEVNVDTWDLSPAAGDRFLLCSDGLIDEIDDDSIAGILKEGLPAQETVDRLVGAALDHGGSDNVTIVLIDVKSVDAEGAVDAERAVDAEGTVAPAGPDHTEIGAAAPAASAAAPDAELPADAPPVAAAPVEAAPAASPVDPAPVEPPPTARAVTGMVPAVRRRRVTPRVVIFIVALVVVVGGALYSVYWYARGGYYVGLSGTQVTIFKGRPGGVLWLKPTVAQSTGVTTAEVLSSSLPQLQAGMEEASLSDARQYVSNLVTAYQAATPTPTTTTTTPTETSSTTSTSVP